MVATTDVQLFANNKSATLNNDVAVPDTSLVLTAGQGAAFPSPAAGQFFAVTIQSTITGAYEVGYCTVRSGDVLNVERAQEGTTAQAFLAASSVVQMRLTKGSLERLQNQGPAGTVAVTGNWTFDPRITIHESLGVANERTVEFLHDASALTCQFLSDAGVPGSIPFLNVTHVLGDPLDTEMRATNSISLVSATTQLLGEIANITGGVSFLSEVAAAQITSNQNNYSPTSMANVHLLVLTSDAARSITGFATGTPGRSLDLKNNGSFAITLVNESVSSIAANRFSFPYGSIVIQPAETIHLAYNGLANRWNYLFSTTYFGQGVPFLPEDTVPDAAADYVLTYDISATAPKKVKLSNLTIGLGGSVGTLSAEILADTPLGYWKLDEASGNFADSSGNGRTMTATTAGLAPSYRYGAWAPRETTKYAFFPSNGSGGTRSDTCGLTIPADANWTFECIGVITQTSAVNGFFGIGGVTEVAADNYQVRARTVAATGVLGAYWENGAGVDNNVNGLVAKLLVAGIPQHLVWVKDGTANTLTLYINGILVDLISYSTEPTGGSAATSQVGANDVSGTTNGPVGMAHAALYATALTSARVRAHAQAAGFLVAA